MLKNTLILAVVFAFGSCKTTEFTNSIDPLDQLEADVSYLASDELEGREVGTKGEILAAKYIASQFQKLGLQSGGDAGTYFQHFEVRQKSNPHEEEASPDDTLIKGRNVIGYIDNQSPYTIVIGAHYDHLGYGGEGSLFVDGRAIHNGADDNASGVAALIELARRFSNRELENNLQFIAFSGEEKGLWGSNFFNKNPTISLESVNFMINMDMVGRLNEERQLAIYGVGTSPVWKEKIESISAPEFKFSLTESGIGPSDHTSFYLSDIPVLHFFTGQHKDYHKPGDDTEWINFAGLGDVVDFIELLILDLDDEEKLTFTKTVDESTVAPSFQVTLGVIPDYLYDGEGMRIDGVREERPAHKAGIEDGDIVLKMGGLEITDMMSYMKALSEFKPGDTVKVIVKRDGREIEKSVTFDE